MVRFFLLEVTVFNNSTIFESSIIGKNIEKTETVILDTLKVLRFYRSTLHQ